ncbi:MAG: isoprenylcysteine carboxyl methyltransferase family protein [Vulcanimicrobiota bacterium]
MVTPAVFSVLVVAMACQRLWELSRSARNEATLRARGGYEVGGGHFWVMRLVHTGWLLGCLLEVWWAPVSWPGLAVLGWLGLVLGQSLRYAAIRQLGSRWTVRAMVVPDERVVSGGVFRYLRHPNYLGVVIELAGFPLIGGCVRTALVFSLANALLLKVRIAAEEKALREETDYGQAFG